MENNQEENEEYVPWFPVDNEPYKEPKKKNTMWTRYGRWEINAIIQRFMKKCRYGLTITEISWGLKLCRKVVSEEIAKLSAKGKVYVRTVGNAKLCYLPLHCRFMKKQDEFIKDFHEDE